MSSTVFFADMRERKGRNKLDKVVRLMEAADFGSVISEGDLVAVKIHFGERGNTSYIHPVLVRAVIDRIRDYGGKPFLTDANTLYVGSRSNAVDHLKTAVMNGFDYSVAGAPLIIADGLRGMDYVTVETPFRHFSEVKISSAAHHADAIVALSHFKGHEIAGFGGALKNIGMGLGAPAGKQMMHSDVLPTVDTAKCVACGRCLKWCPGAAITLRGETEAAKAVIEQESCIGCGECTVVCPERAIAINWKTAPETIQQKIVEYCYGVLNEKKGKCAFINFLTDISPDCDCYDWSDAPVVRDIGYLSSKDPVAIDQASVELFEKEQPIEESRLGEVSGPKEDKLFALHGMEWHHQLEYAEEIGLGSRAFQLKAI